LVTQVEVQNALMAEVDVELTLLGRAWTKRYWLMV
jgi:hypothetical protein